MKVRLDVVAACVAVSCPALLGGCATNSTANSGDYRGERLVTPRGTYAYCPPPCYQPQWYGPQWYGRFGELGDRQFYYPATPYLYDPFDPFWSDGWLIYQRPVPTPRKPPARPTTPKPPASQAAGATSTPATKPPPARRASPRPAPTKAIE